MRYRNFAEDGNQLISPVVDLVPQLQASQLQNYPLHSPIEAGDTPGHDDYYGEELNGKLYFARMLWFDCRVDWR